jgi:hypothetical protein
MAEQMCPYCGLPKELWQGNEGDGYDKDDMTFCCQGCAEGTGCTCKVPGVIDSPVPER